MWRWAVWILAVFLLLLSSAIAVLWVRSYYAIDTFCCVQPGPPTWRYRAIMLNYGGVDFAYQESPSTYVVDPANPKPRTRFYHARSNGEPSGYPYQRLPPGYKQYWRGAGFQYVRGSGSGFSPTIYAFRIEYADFVVPFWFLLLLTSAFPAIIGFRYIRRRRREAARGFPVLIHEPH